MNNAEQELIFGRVIPINKLCFIGKRGDYLKRLKHIVIWKILRLPVALFLWIRFNYTYKPAVKIDGPFLMIANHITDLDPLMVGCGLRRYMHFVASEHLFRKGLLSKLLIWISAPIARIKGSTDTMSAMNIMRTLRHKSNVGLFAEGDRSWNGVTSRLHPTTARLIKASKSTLVTYRITGGYLTSPRWRNKVRRGKMSGCVVNVYAPDKLAEMTDSDLNEAVSRDIYEDAYETQRNEQVVYRGRKLAEGLEKALYTCPVCKGVGTMHSNGNKFFCDCGLTVTYSKYGLFEGDLRPFDTIRDWDTWQEQFLRSYVTTIGQGPIYRDIGQSLWRIDIDHSETLVTEGALELYKDRMVIGEFSVPLHKLYQMGVYGSGMIVLSAEGINYEIKSSVQRSGRKYLTMHKILTEEDIGNEVSAVPV